MKTKRLFLSIAINPIIETLEGRRLLAAQLIDGTAGPDVITIGGTSTLDVTVNGVLTSFPTTNIDTVHVTAEAGDDSVTVTALPTGITAVSIDGGDGNDTIDTSAVGVSADTLSGGGGGGGGGSTPTSLDVTLIGGAGNDSLTAGAGDDSLNGGADNDTLTGGAGDDTLDGGIGADSISGGMGIDTADYSSRVNPVSVTLDGVANDGEVGEGDNIPADVEVITGGSANDTLDAKRLKQFGHPQRRPRQR